ncbi:MAG: hypothetical protein JWO06_4092 [Bacteroidota bacterium]|nr:hypothetical protein [Bacteroidota bacterium]
MKIVHYEYRLRAFTADGEMAIQLVAKPIRHYSDLVDFLPTGDLMPVRNPKARKTAQVASRYYFGTLKIDMSAEKPGYKSRNNGSKESWNTCIKK